AGGDVAAVGGESDAIDVAAELAITLLLLGVGDFPQVGVAVVAAREELVAVLGYGHAVHVLGMREAFGFTAGLEVPEPDRGVPARREDLGVVGMEGDPVNLLRVAAENELILALQAPDTNREIETARHRVFAVLRESDAADFVAMALEPAQLADLADRAVNFRIDEPSRDRLDPLARLEPA